MTRADILQKLNIIHQQALGFKVSDIDENEKIQNLGINSLTMLYMILAMEREFKIKFNIEEIANLKTVKDLIDIIERLI